MTARPIRVVIAEDQALLRSSLVALLEASEGIEVVGQAEDGAEAVAVATRVRPDVVLMDIRMPRLDGLTAASRILARDERVRVLILTMFELESYVYEALRMGASGFLLKDTTPEGIVQAIVTVHSGQALLAPTAVRALVDRFVPRPACVASIDGLTARQTEVLRLVARGMSNHQIAEHLHISHATMKSHMSALLQRVGARDRAQLVIFAYESGLVGAG
ncbi:MAG: response regulator transcription factor [Actinomycetaceae bacterium]|nr:response regulator transcription factor [Actinomycetaceae bacterium]